MAASTPIRLNSNSPLEIWSDFPASELSSGTPASIGYRWIDNQAAGIVAGVCEAEANLGHWIRWPVHEFMIILEGEAVVTEENSENLMSVGECYFIPKGRRCIWKQRMRSKKIVFIFDDTTNLPEDQSHPIVKIDFSDLPVAPTASVSGQLYKSVAIDLVREQYTDPSRRLCIGSWTSNSFSGHVAQFPRTEFLYLLNGTIFIKNKLGFFEIFSAGETLLIPIGAEFYWKSTGFIKAIYCGIH